MRTFGMEVECLLDSPEDAVVAVNEAIRTARNTGTLTNSRDFRARYTREMNSSCDHIGIDEEGNGIECRLPPLTLAEWPLVPVVLRALRQAGATVDTSTGGHMHFGWNHLAMEERPAAVTVWAGTWNVFDTTLRRLVARSRRDNGNCYAAPPMNWQDYFTDYQNSRNVFRRTSWGDVMSFHSGADYTGIAVIPYKADFCTTEVRLHQGSLNPRRWYYWGILMQGLLDFSEAMARRNDLTPLQNAFNAQRAFSVTDLEGRTQHLLSVVRPFMPRYRFRGLTAQLRERMTAYNR